VIFGPEISFQDPVAYQYELGNRKEGPGKGKTDRQQQYASDI
jgi:hypothetical protein